MSSVPHHDAQLDGNHGILKKVQIRPVNRFFVNFLIGPILDHAFQTILNLFVKNVKKSHTFSKMMAKLGGGGSEVFLKAKKKENFTCLFNFI